MTEATPLYSFDDTVYAYIYGVVDQKNRLVGYIVAGASPDAPPIMEYSVHPWRYLTIVSKEKVYFGKTIGYVFEENNELISFAVNEKINTSKQDLLQKEQIITDRNAIYEKWTSLKEDISTNSTRSLARSQTRLSVDTPDYGAVYECSIASMAMLMDTLGRRIEPGLLNVNRPHSIGLQDYFYGRFGDALTFSQIGPALQAYANQVRYATPTWSYFFEYADNVSQNTSVFNRHKQEINAGRPTLVGYNDTVGNKIHIMLGIGYTSNGDYICRDTWALDGVPMREYYSDYLGVYYRVIGLVPSGTSTWGTVTLRSGSQHSDVYRLKAMLKALYYEPGTMSNTFDTNTYNAVRAFQSDNGLTADGVVGSGTYKKLMTAHIMKFDGYTGNWRVLSMNKKGDDVAQLQWRLKYLNYYSGTIDGIFGQSTYNAVYNYQRYETPYTADGMAGSNTLAHLYSTAYQNP